MKYVIATIDFLLSKGFIIDEHWRKSTDGTKVILHYDMIKPTLDSTDIVDVYEYDSSELTKILNSSEWTNGVDSNTTPS